MARTINRIPYTVRTPNSNDLKQYDFNHYNWKGIVDDHNILTVDQETFENAENVYADKHNLLKSRPSLKPVEVSYIDGKNKVFVNNIRYIWSLGDGVIYDYDDGHVFINDKLSLNLPSSVDKTYNYVRFKNDVIQFSTSNGNDVEYKMFNLVDKVEIDKTKLLYIPKEVDGKSEPVNQLTTSKQIVYNILDVNDANRSMFGYIYEVVHDDEVINKRLPVFNEIDLKNIFVNFNEGVEIVDVKRNKNTGRDVILYKTLSENMYFVLYEGGLVSITGFTPLAISNDAKCVYGATLEEPEGSEFFKITFNYYDLSTETYVTKIYNDADDGSLEIGYLTNPKLYLVLMENANNYAIVLSGSNKDQIIKWQINGEDETFRRWTAHASDEINSYLGNKYYLLNGDLFSIVCTTISSLGTFVGGGSLNKVNYALNKNTDEVVSLGTVLLSTSAQESGRYLYEYSYDNLKLEGDTLTFKFLNSETDNGMNGPMHISLNEYKVSLTEKTILEKTVLAEQRDVPNYSYTASYMKLISKYGDGFSYYSYDISLIGGTLKSQTVLSENSYVIISDDYASYENTKFFLGSYLYRNDETSSSTNNLPLLNESVELRRTVDGVDSLIYPDIVKVFGNRIVMTSDNLLFVSEYAEEFGQFKLHFPHKTEFSKTITNIQYLNDTQFAVFLDDEIYHVSSAVNDSNVTYYSYAKSKLDIGCTSGSDVITSFDGVYSIFPSKRGLAYLSYQQFVASTDQTATFISDTINERFKAINNGPIKLDKEDYWIYVYKPGCNFLYLLDNRNGSWWYWTFTKNISSLIVDDDVKLLIDGKLYEFSYTDTDYYDLINDVQEKINWYFESQKLFLNAPNNYKTITNFSLMSVSDLEEPVTVDLLCTTYRDVSDKSRKEFLEYDVDVTRVFSKRLNYGKVVEFKYKLSSDDDTLYQIPLSLSNISIRYKVGGLIK